ncbi:uncharacterized protein CC84DRAFT_359324 [Paraphaeosphaeria sporulosa]|uniref:Uncharacterized protein n=1 Tax=Paraphaeosphaeria sporulosa TaxID=1460663 RepID=A0A177BZD8_9PLEO|nr:uncharacterized protein CC84DRAFT_359324 [Paraphaeosphaeria sporulosa]OAG00079.1 hypothetical protein CC84DRAFT_359324 [Paraphaeosphaeria sporulosa]
MSDSMHEAVQLLLLMDDVLGKGTGLIPVWYCLAQRPKQNFLFAHYAKACPLSNLASYYIVNLKQVSECEQPFLSCFAVFFFQPFTVTHSALPRHTISESTRTSRLLLGFSGPKSLLTTIFLVLPTCRRIRSRIRNSFFGSHFLPVNSPLVL